MANTKYIYIYQKSNTRPYMDLIFFLSFFLFFSLPFFRLLLLLLEVSKVMGLDDVYKRNAMV